MDGWPEPVPAKAGADHDGGDKGNRIPYKPDTPRRTEPMPATHTYPAEIERDEDGRYVVTFPDFGWGATDGATRVEALEEAKDLLRELIATTIREGEALPEPSHAGKRGPTVIPLM